MPRMHAVGSIAVGIVLMARSALAIEPADLTKYGWRTDYESARAEAKRSGKPLMVVFRCEP